MRSFRGKVYTNRIKYGLSLEMDVNCLPANLPLKSQFEGLISLNR